MYGAQSVMTVGATQMQKSFVVSWDSLAEVSVILSSMFAVRACVRCANGMKIFMHVLDAVAHGSARFGVGTGPILMDDVLCTGTETRLVNCIHTTQHNCGHHEDASVICNLIGK